MADIIEAAGESTDFYSRLDPSLVQEAYLDNEWHDLPYKSGTKANIIRAEAVLTRQALIDSALRQVNLVATRYHQSQDESFEVTPEVSEAIITEYQQVLESTGFQKTTQEFQTMMDIRASLTEGTRFVSGDEVYTIVETDGYPLVHISSAQESVSPLYEMGWQVKAQDKNGDVVTVLVDSYMSVGDEAIIASVREHMWRDIRDCNVSIEEYQRALSIFTSLDAKDEIKTLKRDAAHSAHNDIADHSGGTTIWIERGITLLGIVDSEQLQDVKDTMAKRIANNDEPRESDMRFYWALSSCLAEQDGRAEKNDFDSVRAVFELYLAERDRGIRLLEQEELVAEAKTLAA